MKRGPGTRVRGTLRLVRRTRGTVVSFDTSSNVYVHRLLCRDEGKDSWMPSDGNKSHGRTKVRMLHIKEIMHLSKKKSLSVHLCVRQKKSFTRSLRFC